MTIRGKFEYDGNFITVCCDNKLYTIARNTGEWGFLPVGGITALGMVLTQADFDRIAARMTQYGEFELIRTETLLK